jgi:hypothetical protein
MRNINIGIIGFGTIGSGVVKILNTNGDIIKKRLGAEIKLVKIADLDTETDRGVKIGSELLTSDAQEVIKHPEVDVVVELIGGYDVNNSEPILTPRSVSVSRSAILTSLISAPRRFLIMSPLVFKILTTPEPIVPKPIIPILILRIINIRRCN